MSSESNTALRRECRALRFALGGKRQDVSEEMELAALPGGALEVAAYRGLYPLMVIGNHHEDARKAPGFRSRKVSDQVVVFSVSAILTARISRFPCRFTPSPRAPPWRPHERFLSPSRTWRPRRGRVGVGLELSRSPDLELLVQLGRQLRLPCWDENDGRKASR